MSAYSFFDSFMMFIIASAGISFILMLYHFSKDQTVRDSIKHGDAKNALNAIKIYFSTLEGKKIKRGIVFAFSFVLFFGTLGLMFECNKAQAATYFNDASVYFGLDYAKNDNSFCDIAGVDNRTVSNLGLKFNLIRTSDNRFNLNTKYTHHSCAFNTDAVTYDAMGFEAEYKFWIK